MKTYAIRFKLEEEKDGIRCCSVDAIEKKPGLIFTTRLSGAARLILFPLTA